MYIFYRIARVWYVSVYVYFLPFLAIILNILIPFVVKNNKTTTTQVIA